MVWGMRKREYNLKKRRANRSVFGYRECGTGTEKGCWRIPFRTTQTHHRPDGTRMFSPPRQGQRNGAMKGALREEKRDYIKSNQSKYPISFSNVCVCSFYLFYWVPSRIFCCLFGQLWCAVIITKAKSSEAAVSVKCRESALFASVAFFPLIIGFVGPARVLLSSVLFWTESDCPSLMSFSFCFLKITFC